MSDKRRLYRILIAAVAALGVLSIVIVCFIKYTPTSKWLTAEEYFGTLSENECFVVVEDYIAQERALIEDGNIYIDYALVQAELNDRFYWDASVGELLYTTQDLTLEIPPNTSNYYADGETLDAGYEIIKTTSGGMFLAANFMQQFSDLTYTMYESPSRLVVEFGSRPYIDATVKRDTAVRYQGGIKSKIITKVMEDSHVKVIDRMDHWTKIATEDGYIGFVKNKSLKNISEEVSTTYYAVSEQEPLPFEGKVNLTWDQIDVWENNANLEARIADMTGVNVISPTWFALLDNTGEVASLADPEYVKKAHDRGLQVWALLNNFSPDVSTTTILSSKEARNKIQEYLVAKALELEIDGINIDLEGIAQEAGYSYVQFMRELSVLCRKNQIILSVDVPVPMDFSAFYNRAELGRVCDYVIMMGYDEHYYGSEVAGSVASMSFEENGLVNMIKEVPVNKVISGIPFYSRIWYTAVSDSGETVVTSETVTMQEAQDLLAQLQLQTTYDETTGQNYATWTDEQGRTCEIWLEDTFSITKRVELVKNYAVGGIAHWVLGHETNDVWEIIREGLAL